jgi:hypothetical protein
MTRNSVFYKLVTKEDSYTQLLCNLMTRCVDFRAHALRLLLLESQASSGLGRFDTQTRLPECGRPDIVIHTDEICALMEVKINPKRRLTAYQELPFCGDDDTSDSFTRKLLTSKNYFGFLHRQRWAAEKWLVFLVPKDWRDRDRVQKLLVALKRTHPDINTHIAYWESVVDIIRNTGSPITNPLLEEFGNLLAERFPLLQFSKEEASMLFSKDFVGPLVALRQLDEVVAQIWKEAKKSKLDSTEPKQPRKDEYGIYFKVGKKWPLWFGVWTEFWKEEGKPLCFGIQHDPSGQAYIKAFKASYKGERMEFKDEEGNVWTMGWVSQEDLESKDCAERVWSILKPVIQAIRKQG